MVNEIKIFNYEDFRKYLEDWFGREQKANGLTFRDVSAQLGFKSPNYLWLIIRGKRGLSRDAQNKIAAFLGLSPKETEYFRLMVDFGQAKTLEQKKAALNAMQAFLKKKGFELKAEQYHYLTHWHYAAIFEMIQLKDFQPDGEWIAARLNHLITPAQARKSLAVLEHLGLIEKDAAAKLKQKQAYVTTGNQAQMLASVLYHEQMTELVLDAIKNKAPTERNVTALTFTMRKKDFDDLVAEMDQFRKRLVGFLQSRLVQDQDDDLYQFSMNLVPLTV